MRQKSTTYEEITRDVNRMLDLITGTGPQPKPKRPRPPKEMSQQTASISSKLLGDIETQCIRGVYEYDDGGGYVGYIPLEWSYYVNKRLVTKSEFMRLVFLCKVREAMQ